MSVAALPDLPPIQAPAAAPPKAPGRWIAGPVYDAAFFLFPTLFAALFVAAYLPFQTNTSVIAFLNATILTFGLAHAFGTWFFFFDRENLAHYYRNQFFGFFVMPVLIFAAVIGLWYLELHWRNTGTKIIGDYTWLGIVNTVAYVWVHYHLTRQNVGFVGIYRHRHGITDPAQKDVDNRAIYLTALFLYMAGWYYANGPVFMEILRAPWVGLVAEYTRPGHEPVHGPGLMAFIAFFALLALARCLWHRLRDLVATRGRSWPHLAMIATSLLFPMPMLFAITEPEPVWLMFGNTSFGLFAHYVQYVALLLLIAWNKYPPAVASAMENKEVHVSRLHFFGNRVNGMYLMVGFIVVFALLLYGLNIGLRQSGVQALMPLASAILIGFGMIHYWHDGLIWAFKDEFNRRSILPYLRPPR